MNPYYPQPMLQESGPIKYGREECESMLERLENRKRIKEFKGILEKYPHTTGKLLGKVVSNNSHLRYERAESFVPDFPREATNAMKEYDQMCIELTNKKAVFYVLAQGRDFEQRSRRRDPILLTQSPFGFFWQILGAWDEEMQYLDEL